MMGNLYKRCTLGVVIVLIAVCASNSEGLLKAFAADKSATSVPSSNPLSGDPEAIQQGQKLFFKWCVQCHGPKADGQSRFGKYAKDLRKFKQGFSQFVVIVVNGRRKKRMPAWRGVISGDEIAQIGAYLETLAIEGAKWQDNY
ncbi:hypothetical protein NKDENANG_02059 [Candidatus Entotheonellaceae bacterium PAL068K]